MRSPAPLPPACPSEPVAAPRLVWSGVAALATGLTARIWAARVLGAFHTRTLRASAAPPLDDGGPYRVVRHPGYLGVLLSGLGAGLAAANVVAAGWIALWIGRAYHTRTRSEEALLAATYGEAYTAYARRTWRLVPWVY